MKASNLNNYSIGSPFKLIRFSLQGTQVYYILTDTD